MKSKNVISAIFLVILFWHSGKSQSNNDEFFRNDLNLKEAFSTAKKESKSVYILFGEKCGWCKKFKNETLKEKKVHKFFIENFLSINIDETSEEGKRIAEIFNVYAYPTHLFFNSSGELTLFDSNFSKKRNFLRISRKSLSKPFEHLPLLNFYWAGLHTKNKKIYDLVNINFKVFLDYFDYLNSKGVLTNKENDLTYNNLKESMMIEEYYYNLYLSSIIAFKNRQISKSKMFANKALNIAVPSLYFRSDLSKSNLNFVLDYSQ